ncbi:MAG: hypothetical protein ACK56F_06480 [bacterium]
MALLMSASVTSSWRRFWAMSASPLRRAEMNARTPLRSSSVRPWLPLNCLRRARSEASICTCAALRALSISTRAASWFLAKMSLSILRR